MLYVVYIKFCWRDEMENKHNIKEISELFQIPKSTLRYWHGEGLIHFDRDLSNDYRRFSLKTIMDISDIAFYRSLNVPIEELKHLTERNIDELEDMIKESGRKVEEQIHELQEMTRKIETRMKRINQYRQFLEQPYSLGKPNFQKLVINNFMDREYTQQYLSDPYSAAILIPYEDKSKFEYGIVVTNEYHGSDLLWTMDESSSDFVHCLLKVPAYTSNTDCLNEHQLYFHEHGYKMGLAVGRYLVTAYDKCLYDYYEGWIEIQ
jgi:DNA-binding transcriptional MerR regulator